MIGYIFLDELFCPFFSCDVCDMTIDDHRLAMAAWPQDMLTAGVPVMSSHVHKKCLDAFEADIVVSGYRLMTVELTEHVRQLARNTK